MDNKEQTLFEMIMPYAAREAARVQAENIRFSHYTSAATGLLILRNNHVRLRNAALMNDFSEIEHGIECLRHALRQEEEGALDSVLEAVSPGLWGSVVAEVNAHLPHLRADTYLISLSEHGRIQLEDSIGRLSMWRAYGGSAGVCFVLNNAPFVSESVALNAFTSPVFYADRNQFAEEFASIIRNIASGVDFLRELPVDTVRIGLVNMLHFAILGTKHPGFTEESEWRVIYQPTLRPSDKIESEFVTVGDTPQRIHKIAFRDYPDQGLVGATIPDLLDRIIIGPCESPDAIWEAYVDQLERCGVDRPEEKVIKSGIPLRR